MKYIIPKSYIPHPFSQNIKDKNGKLITSVGSCVACTFTKILEVINYIKTGAYIKLSKGYMYGRNNYPDKKGQGMDEEYTLNILLNRGTVPYSLCKDYDEIPDIIKTLNKRADIQLLDEEAKKYKIQSWENISGSSNEEMFQNIKYYLQKYNIPLAGVIKKYMGEKHSVVIVGYDENNILFHNHTGKSDIESLPYDRFSKAYYLDGGINNMKFTDVNESDWFYDVVKEVYDKGPMKGTSETQFEPNRPITRAEMAVLLTRILKYK